MTWTLHLGDCLEYLRTLPSNSVDAVVTDPPFGIGFKYSQHDDSPDGYGPWLWSVIEECERAAKPGSFIAVWQAMLNAPRFSEWFPRKYRVFAACKNFVQIRPCAMQYSFDPVVVWWKEGDKPYSLGTASRDFHVADTTPIGRKKRGDVVEGHPCPRPLHQVTHMIEQWVRPGATVLDPFSGSGTTGVSCVKTGRNFIGCEIDPAYHAIATRRLKEAEAADGLYSQACGGGS